MAGLVLSLYLAQNAQAVDQYSDLSGTVADNHSSGDAFGGADPFDGSMATPTGNSSVQNQEAKVDAEFSEVGGNDLLYPASDTMTSPNQIENASSYASPPSYPRSEVPAKRFEKASKKKSWAKKSAKKSKNKIAKKKSKKGKKISQAKKRKKLAQR